MRPSGRVSAVGVVTLPLLLGSILNAPFIAAYEHNCGRYGVAQTGTIKFQFFSVTTDYQTNHVTAANNWNNQRAALTPGEFPRQQHVSSHSGYNTGVYDGLYDWDERAFHRGTCIIGGLWFNARTVIEYNVRVMQYDSIATRRGTAAHEIGHSYGLAHNWQSCSSDPSRMRAPSNTCSGSLPLLDDLQGVKAKWD